MTTHPTRLRRTRWLAVLAVLFASSPATAAEPTAARPKPKEARSEPAKWPLATAAPRPTPVPTPEPEAIDEAIRRGVAFLLARQNEDGSWGSARNTKGLNIYAPVPGAHQAFRAAVTSLAISALVETESDDPRVLEALDRGEAWMFDHLAHVRRANADAIYNNWAHAYSIQALVRMFNRHADDPEVRKKIRELLDLQLDLLRRYECVDGGWCYYDFDYGTQKPAGSTISFVTATVLVALDEARRIGVEIPDKLIQRAKESIRRQRNPDFSYCYGEYLKYTPRMGINRPGGSLGRSQACNLAMRLWGDEEVTDEILIAWLDRLFARNLWLDIGRKRPVPHESWFQVAGYFFYYGHYYAALCIEQLEPSERPRHQDQLAQVLLGFQEKDGSWWDYPFYDYHQQYGTAFAVMTLVRCRHAPAE